MHTVITRHEVGALVAGWKRAGETLAFVPTMGNLHDGHLRLVDAARAGADRVAVSIFVNPLQFDDPADLARYPRTLEQDVERLQGSGVDLLFVPAVDQIYPRGEQAGTRIEVSGLSDILCGEFRPGHFSGVATVVAILFHIVQPERAVFGSKDFQQLLVVRRMVEELAFPIVIDAVDTVREADGLALSSRNRHLSADERQRAPMIYRALCGVRQRWLAGEREIAALEGDARQQLENAGFRPEYISIRRAVDLAVPTPADERLVMLVAAWLGNTRLIDNLLL